MRLKIGQKVTWNGSTAKYDSFDWLKKGMKGRVIKHYPRVKGTGIVLDYEDDGTAIIDKGTSECWTIDFGIAGLRCINREDLGEILLLDNKGYIEVEQLVFLVGLGVLAVISLVIGIIF